MALLSGLGPNGSYVPFGGGPRCDSAEIAFFSCGLADVHTCGFSVC